MINTPELELLPRFTLANGRMLHLRLMQPDDLPLLLDLRQRTSDESLSRRFHANATNASDTIVQRTARQLANVDNTWRNGAIIATYRDDADEEHIVGVARIARSPEMAETEAEIAYIVRDDYQRNGVGTALIRELVPLAQRMRVETLIARVEPENATARRLVEKMGLAVQAYRHGSEIELRVEVPNAS